MSLNEKAQYAANDKEVDYTSYPEVVSSPSHEHQAPEVVPHNGKEFTKDIPRHIDDGENSPEVVAYPYLQETPHQTAPTRRRLRDRKVPWFFNCSVLWLIVLVAFVMIVALAVGLGAGLSMSKDNKSTNTSSSSSPTSTSSGSTATSTATTAEKTIDPMLNSGLAMTFLTDSTNAGLTCIYYQASNGSIVEAVFKNATLTSGNFTPEAQYIVTSDATNMTALTTTGWSKDGLFYRQVFFSDSNGHIWQANTSTFQSNWGASAIWTSDSIISKSPSLTACASTGDWDGISVVFGSESADSLVQIVAPLASTDPSWTSIYSLSGTDPSSGAACWFADAGDSTIDIFIMSRETSDGGIMIWEGASNETVSLEGPYGNSTITTSTAYVANGSAMSTVAGSEGGHYIPYQDNGQIMLPLWYFNGTVENSIVLGVGVNKTAIAAAYMEGTDEGNMFLYQNEDATLQLVDISYDGGTIFNMTST